MRTLRVALAVVFAAAGIEAQIPGQLTTGRTGIANVPLVFFGAQNAQGNPGAGGRQGLGQQWYWNSYGLRPYLYSYYGNLYWNNQANLPTGPSYANPGVVQPVGELAAPLVAPANGKTGAEWADVRASFASAAAKVTEAKSAVEELRARLRALGQSPRANLISGASTAEAALKAAQSEMAAGNLEESIREIQRSNYIAAQVLKEFGR